MKKFTEMAFLADAKSELVGVILFDNDSLEYEAVNMHEFEEKVKEGVISYLVWEGDKIVPELTPTEVAELGKRAKVYTNIRTFEDYVKNTMTIQESLFETANNNNLILGAPAMPAKMPFIGTVIPMYLIGKLRMVEDFVTALDPKVSKFVYRVDGKVYILLPVTDTDICEHFCKQLSGIVVDAGILRQSKAINSIDYAKKELGITSLFNKNPDGVAIMKACSMFESITAKTIESVNKGIDDSAMDSMNLF